MVKGKKAHKGKADFPKISLDEALKYSGKIVANASGHIATYEDIGKSIGKSGGNLARIVAGLRHFGLIEKSGIKEWRVTALGKRLGNDRTPQDIFTAFVSPALYADMWAAYKDSKPTQGAAVNYLGRKDLGPKDAKKLAKLFLKSYDLIDKSAVSPVPGASPAKEQLVPQEIDLEIYELAELVGTLFPAKETEDISKSFSRLEELVNSKGLKELAGFLIAIKISTPPEELQNKLNLIAPKARELFMKELKQRKIEKLTSKNSEIENEA